MWKYSQCGVYQGMNWGSCGDEKLGGFLVEEVR